MARNLVSRPGPSSSNTARLKGSSPGGGIEQHLQDRLVQDNLGFVIKVACEHRNLGLPLGDLVNEGCLGLIEASKRYDPSRGVKFITYAAAWVRKSILQALLRHTRMIRVPPYYLDQLKQYRRAESVLASQLGRKPRRDEVSHKLATSGAKLDTLLSRRIMEIPLDNGEPLAPGSSPISRVEDKQAGNPEDELLKDENRLLVERALSVLTERERFIIEYRFGLRQERLESLAEVGAKLGLSRERVRQIEHQARVKMRRALLKKRLSGWDTRAIMGERDSFARQPERPRTRRGKNGMPD